MCDMPITQHSTLGKWQRCRSSKAKKKLKAKAANEKTKTEILAKKVFKLKQQILKFKQTKTLGGPRANSKPNEKLGA